MLDFLHLLYGTLLLRPYVFSFLAVYLIAATAHIGWRRAITFVPVGYSLAWLSEFSSIHCGFPYGDYYYIQDTIDRELWVFGVPFMDSLSYVFLSYCSYSMAVFLLSPVTFASGRTYILETRKIRRSWQTLILGAFLFVLLDIIIDPLSLQGYRWFLGQIYGYREIGLYFGIPMSNFGGWLLVGLVLVGVLQTLDCFPALEPEKTSWHQHVPNIGMLGPLLYVSVLAFNLTVTFQIGEYLMGIVGCLLTLFPTLLAFFFTLFKHQNLTRKQLDAHIKDFPVSSTALHITTAPHKADLGSYLT